MAHDDCRAESRPGRAVAVCPALTVPEFVKRLTIHFVSLQCCDMCMYMQSYHNVTLAYGDSKTGQSARAVPFSPAFAVCDECVLGCVNRFDIHSLILQCCDMLHVHGMIQQYHLEQQDMAAWQGCSFQPCLCGVQWSCAELCQEVSYTFLELAVL